jgi:hypothetical protein
MFRRLALAAFAVSGWICNTAHAVVISDTQILLSPTSEFGADYAITAVQAPDRFDPTTLWFSKVDSASQSTLTPITWNVDEEADYYLAQAGTAVTLQTLSSGQFTPLFKLDQAFSLNVPLNSDFYLAVATSDGSSSNPVRDVFGWVHLKNDASGLSILGSAMAYGEGGIVVGTTTPVPEPDTFALASVGLAALALGLRASKRRAAMPRTSPDLSLP